jgi:hypothetical protein
MSYLTRWAVLAGLTGVLLTGCGGARSAGPAGDPGPSGPHSTGGQESQSTAGLTSEISAYLSDLSRRNQFAGAVLVANGGHVVLRAGYGLADAAIKRPPRRTSRDSPSSRRSAKLSEPPAGSHDAPLRRTRARTRARNSSTANGLTR